MTSNILTTTRWLSGLRLPLLRLLLILILSKQTSSRVGVPEQIRRRLRRLILLVLVLAEDATEAPRCGWLRGRRVAEN